MISDRFARTRSRVWHWPPGDALALRVLAPVLRVLAPVLRALAPALRVFAHVLRALALTLALAGAMAPAHGAVVAGGGTTVVLPVAAQTASFASEVVVHAPGGAAATFSVTFHEAIGSTSPGSKACTPVVVPAGRVVSFNLAAQCSLGTGSRFGMLQITDTANPKVNLVQAYSRTSNPQGQGFSVEGFPIGVFSGAAGSVAGLRRMAAAPIYQTNCFVAALAESVQYEIALKANPGGATIGAPITGSLSPWQMRRFLDVFGPNGANAPAGDYANVTAEFRQTGPGNPAYLGFCTVQDSTSFGADFRIAKNVYRDDQTRLRSLAYGHDGTGTLTTPAQVMATGEKNVHLANVRPPDNVKCDVVGPNAGALELRAATTDGAVLGGGDNAASATFATGGRAAHDGTAPSIRIEVGVRESANPAHPVAYGLTCSAGNGMGWPWWWRREADDF